MRTLAATALAVLLVPLAARADDTKPPLISEVKATLRGGQVQVEARITDETGVLSATCHHRSGGGKWEDSPMMKNNYDDVFKASFAGGADTEYWIDSSDLLGNGPATYGAASKPYAVASSKSSKEIATREPPPKRRPVEARPPPPSEKVAKAGPPVIEHRKPSIALPEGQEVTLRARVHGDSPILFTGVFVRQRGEAGPGTTVELNKVEGENYVATIPADRARGTVEYLLAAKDKSGQQTFLGADGSVLSKKDVAPPTYFSIAFKPKALAEPPFAFAVNPPVRVQPGKAVIVRAQITGPLQGEEPTVPAKAQVLWRGNDGQDQIADMQPDPTGGLGGFRTEIPPQSDGAVYYQIVACDGSGNKCAVSTGSRRKWHAVAIAAAPGGAKPLPLDAMSSKAPGSLPE